MPTGFITRFFSVSSQAVNVTNTDGSVVETPPNRSHGVSAQMDSTSQVRKCVLLSEVIVRNHKARTGKIVEHVQLFVLLHVV